MSGAARVLVIGDALLDVDVEGRVERTTPDAGLPVLDVTREVERPGGAGLAAALLAADGVAVTLVTALCADAEGARLEVLLGRGRDTGAPGRVDVIAGPATGGTTVKTRLAGLARVDRGAGRPGDSFEAVVAGPLRTAVHNAGAVLVSDYGRGVAENPLIRSVVADAILAGVPVVWDPHPRGPAPVPGIAVVTPNLAEARAVAGHDGSARTVGRQVRLAWSSQVVAVTCGAQGAVVVGSGDVGGGRVMQVRAPRVHGGDPCGAGDAFAGSLAVALAEGLPAVDAVRRAVLRASRFVGDGGARSFAARVDVGMNVLETTATI